MSATRQDFEDFSTLVDLALQEVGYIAEIPEHTTDQQEREVEAVVVRALNKMQQSPIGRPVLSDPQLTKVYHSLENRLQWLVTRLPSESGESDVIVARSWVLAGSAYHRRRLIFWAEMAKLLYRFGEVGTYATLDQERELRKAITDHTEPLADALRKLLTHVQGEFSVEKTDRPILRRASETLAQLKDVQFRPFNDEYKRLLEKDFDVIARQYAHRVCLLALEQFGHITKAHLDVLIGLKSVRSLREGVALWRSPGVITKRKGIVQVQTQAQLEDAVRKRLGDYIDKALLESATQCHKKHWPVASILEMVNQHPNVLDQSMAERISTRPGH